MKLRKNQEGQVLLIVVMLLATVITVVLATTFTVRTDTQTTKLEEESQRSLAAAEAGVEAAIARGLTAGQTIQVGDVSTDLQNAGFTGDITASNYPASGNSFTTPLLRQDEQYTYYLANYDRTSNTFSSFASHNLTICFGSSSSQPAIEVTVINNSVSPVALTRTLIESQSGRTSGSSIVTASAGCSADSSYSYNATINGVTGGVAIFRVLYASSAIYVTDSSMRTQGLLISSSAKSLIGTTKVIQLFSSYPQFPADLFVTQF